MVQPYERFVEGGADRCGHPDAARADSRRRRSAGHFRRRPGLRRLPHRAIRCLEGLAPCPGNAESHRVNSARRLRQRVARAFWGHDHLLPQWRQVYGPHRRPGWRIARLSGRLHHRRLSATAIPDRISGRAAAGARRRLGQPGKGAGRPALVPPLSRPPSSSPATHCTGPAAIRPGTTSAPIATRPI